MAIKLSIIIPAYNAEQWLQPTVEHILAALQRAPLFAAELIIVNDGSRDKTWQVMQQLQTGEVPLRLLDQPNKGRFLARQVCFEKATGEYVLFVDSRVYLTPDSLAFVAGQLQEHPERKVWNGHIIVEKAGNIIARFGDAVTFIGWRRYFRHPKLTSYGLEDFDYYPKGTGCFLAPRSLLVESIQEFVKTTHDLQHSSDDTLLIRLIAAKERIYLSPEFSAIYHARTRLRQFVHHTYNRGQFFIDGFLRPGTRFYYPLIGFLIGSVLVLLSAIVFWWLLLLPYVILAVTVWVMGLGAALLMGTPVKDALSLWLLSPLFAVVYGAGIWRATIRKMLKF